MLRWFLITLSDRKIRIRLTFLLLLSFAPPPESISSCTDSTHYINRTLRPPAPQCPSTVARSHPCSHTASWRRFARVAAIKKKRPQPASLAWRGSIGTFEELDRVCHCGLLPVRF